MSTRRSLLISSRASTYFRDKVDVIYGVAYDESLGDRVKVTILAAGFDMEALTTTKESVSEPGIGMNIEPVDAQCRRRAKWCPHR